MIGYLLARLVSRDEHESRVQCALYGMDLHLYKKIFKHLSSCAR